ncbi:MAG: helix-turn-helix transcriptional regulator [Flavobacteriales bacterium]|nr:helix-turn-helix transcriptional regulator [Flavobacteriales bacterium]
MLEFQIRPLFEALGLRHPYKLARRMKLSPSIFKRIITSKQHRIHLHYIEQLCTLLRCTPNDLFAWTPNDKGEDRPENPLQAIRKKDLPKLDELVGKMNLEEVKKKLGEG